MGLARWELEFLKYLFVTSWSEERSTCDEACGARLQTTIENMWLERFSLLWKMKLSGQFLLTQMMKELLKRSLRNTRRRFTLSQWILTEWCERLRKPLEQRWLQQLQKAVWALKHSLPAQMKRREREWELSDARRLEALSSQTSLT